MPSFSPATRFSSFSLFSTYPKMGSNSSKPADEVRSKIISLKVPPNPTPTTDDESDITRPAPRRQLRTLSMLIDPIQLAEVVNGDSKEGRPETSNGSRPATVISPDDYLRPATMFDFERPLSIRERQERVRARIAALQAAPQQRFRDCRRRRRFLNAMRRVLGCGCGVAD